LLELLKNNNLFLELIKIIIKSPATNVINDITVLVLLKCLLYSINLGSPRKVSIAWGRFTI
jgi:hypothetical protein